ncbi:Oidioi.mRNA.OKI2018_I69.PAR.g11799.t1.cds [Oikopleura dioica]|uniref:Oidioi.mRNA.OKI2018_I69.PAR.g11799.t1.cds n=1 Tax=Oikopleura dioica TaxID=34765 RepID=A0ABN7RXG0_OIKDI|nr:Oidioi.mRNA.OKI2018_I69.PAR.g11799.t1.cds [Oikopleura dioica]
MRPRTPARTPQKLLTTASTRKIVFTKTTPRTKPTKEPQHWLPANYDYLEIEPEETASAPPVVEGAFRGNSSISEIIDLESESGGSGATRDFNKGSHFLIIVASFLTYLV